MNTFNTPPSPAHWLPAQKAKPGRNDALTHVRVAIRQQRQTWSNQIGSPPLPESRAGLGLEQWESHLIQEDRLSTAELARWTGRTPGEILQLAEELDPALEDYDGDGSAELAEDFDDVDQISKKKRTIAPNSKETPMTKNTATDDQIRETYEKWYIGRSEPLSVCARKTGCTPQTFANKCRSLNLRLRTSAEGRAATNGQPWRWPDEAAEPTPTPPAEPTEPTPIPEPVASKPEAVEPAPDTSKKPGTRAIVTQRGLEQIAAEFVPQPPARPLWGLNGSSGYHEPALADLAHLVRDLRAAGAGVQIALNVELRIGGDD
jgi:hypothetical protein